MRFLDLTGTRLVAPGAFQAAAQKEFERPFNIPMVSEVYGQTECLGIALSPVGDQRRRATLGVPGPHVEVKLDAPTTPRSRPVR